MREWEEEQVRLDRDWYSGAEEGGVAGDEKHNPLAQYENLGFIKEAEIATKAKASPGFTLRSMSLISGCRRRFPRDRPSM